jgi:hypothetical protein
VREAGHTKERKMFFLMLVIIYVMFRLRMARTLLVLGLLIYSMVLQGFAFLFGFGALYLFNLNPRLYWDDGSRDMPGYLVTYIVDNADMLSTLFLIPLVFPFDVLHKMLWITAVRGHPILWLSMIVGFYFVVLGWYTAIEAFSRTRREILAEHAQKTAKDQQADAIAALPKGTEYITYESGQVERRIR